VSFHLNPAKGIRESESLSLMEWEI